MEGKLYERFRGTDQGLAPLPFDNLIKGLTPVNFNRPGIDPPL
jgi:hypothetical protein